MGLIGHSRTAHLSDNFPRFYGIAHFNGNAAFLHMTQDDANIACYYRHMIADIIRVIPAPRHLVTKSIDNFDHFTIARGKNFLMIYFIIFQIVWKQAF